MTRRIDTRWRRWAYRLAVVVLFLAALAAATVILGSIALTWMETR
jgi:hypothetical protein